MTISVYALKWPPSSYSNEPNDGLWDNNRRVSIHVPFFLDAWGIDTKKICFYFAYADYEPVKPLRRCYMDLNDIVFSEPVWRGTSKIQVFFQTS